MRAGYLRHLVGDVHDSINVKQGVYALAHDGKALKSHAGVDIFLRKLCVVARAVIIKLGEYVVPDLYIAVAVAADGAVGSAAAVFLAAVVVYLAARAAGTRAVLPEVVLLAEAEYALGRYADLVMPDVPRLIVVDINGGIEPVGVKSHPLLGGEKFPAVRDGFMLEVIAEGEIAEHLKIGAVAGGVSYIVDIAGADALLAGAYAPSGRYLLALEPGLHGGHARVYEQYGFIVPGHQRKAGQAEMILAFKKSEEHLSEFIKSVCFHFFILLSIDSLLHGRGSFILNLIIAWGVELISSPASFIMLPAVKAMGSASFVRSSIVSPAQKRFR